LLPVLAGAAFIAAAPVQAANADVTASIIDFRYQLIDLDANDGIAPSIVFDDPYVTVRSSGNGTYENLYGYGHNEVTGPYGVASTSASATDLLSLAGFTSSEHGTQSFGSEASLGRAFTLSPSTGLLVSATGLLSAGSADASRTVAALSFSLSLETPLSGIGGGDYRQQGYSLSQGSGDYLLSGYLATGALAQTGYISLRAESTASYIEPTSPVPEPATWGMLAAGALLVAGAARKRG
jgi:hypothetical protein